MRTVVPKIARAIHYSSFAQVPRSQSVQDGNLYPGGVRAAYGYTITRTDPQRLDSSMCSSAI
jgi:hypothetical protein